MKFTHLHTHSHYSLLDGLGKIDDLVARAKELGMNSLALTDHGNLYGAIEFYQKCKKAGIKPIIGCEMYVAYENMRDKRPGIDDKRYHLIVLAKTNTGYHNLIQLVSKAHLEGFYYKPRIDKTTLREHAQGLIALSGCFNGEIAQAIKNKKNERAEQLIREYQDIFGADNFYLEISPHLSYPDQRVINDGLAALSLKTGAKLVATNDIHYARPDDREAQDILVAVQTGSRIEDEDRLTMKEANLSMRSADEMAVLFPDHPEAIAATEEIAEKCAVEIELGKIKLPEFSVPNGATPDAYLQTLCEDGLKNRYGIQSLGEKTDAATAKIIRERLAYELSVIQKTGFTSYFLIVHDFVHWAKQNGIIVGPGRGSAAGSLVSYLLNIANIDPIKYNLIFERFLNPERISMPDIDLDFADTRRDEVLEYVANKYGRDHVAQIITFGTMAARAAIRDAGRAMGLPYSFCDTIAKIIPFNPTQGEKTGWLKKTLENIAEFKERYERDPEAKRLIDAAMKLEGVARHASTHACGVVIAPKPLSEYVPLQYATRRNERTKGKTAESNSGMEAEKAIVTQYEMHAIEDLGLLKMDFLGLRNLSIIEDTLKLISRLHKKKINPHTLPRGIEPSENNFDSDHSSQPQSDGIFREGGGINIEAIPLDDKKTFALLADARTTGVFQLESQGMKRYLKELKPSELEDIIAMVALYRPGPIELIPSFIRRKYGQERIEYLHPRLEPILKNTYGIGVYQEQMMQIARDLAGYTFAEADTLRKAIGKKIKKLLNAQKEKLIAGMRKNGIDEKIAEAIWELFPPFARYGFNRSHAACYALIGYQTAYLKTHYPAEFMSSLMTAEGFEIERVAFLVDECREMGMEVLPPNVNESFENFSVVSATNNSDRSVGADNTIRFGLNSVKNVGANVVDAIIHTRKNGERFVSLTDFVERVQHKDLNKKSLESLVKCGALDTLGERRQLLENMDAILDYSRSIQRERASGQSNLFSFSPAATPALSSIRLKPADAATKKERMQWEKELLGLYVTEHPMSEYKEQLAAIPKRIPLNRLGDYANKGMIVTAGLITGIKKIITKTGAPMLFVPFEDGESKTELLVFPSTLERTAALWQEERAIKVKGRVTDRDGVIKVICEDAKEL
jgi:DNA polymerase III subunit alpha